MNKTDPATIQNNINQVFGIAEALVKARGLESGLLKNTKLRREAQALVWEEICSPEDEPTPILSVYVGVEMGMVITRVNVCAYVLDITHHDESVEYAFPVRDYEYVNDTLSELFVSFNHNLAK